MRNSKDIIRESLGEKAKDEGFAQARDKDIDRKELHLMKVKLDRSSQIAGYKKFEMNKKERGYITVLNRDEFSDIFQRNWNNIFKNWDWGEYSDYFIAKSKT